MKNVFLKTMRAGLILTPLSIGLSACMGGGAAPTDSSSHTGMFSGFFGQSAAPAPASAQEPAPVEMECPKVDIREGGTNYRQSAEKAVKVQFTIRNVARECTTVGGSMVMKVGIEGIALLGAAGKPGPASAPLTILVTRGDKTIATRLTAAKTIIPADEEQALFRLIEDGIKIPNGQGEVTVSVGFKG